jgi:hypothetical protein
MTKREKETAPLASANPAHRTKRVNRETDIALGWVERDYPQLAAWRVLAMEWMKGETRGVALRLTALVAFLERYLVQQGLPLDPAVFLARSTVLPDFYRTTCPDSPSGINYNNSIHAFLHFVLLRGFSEADGNGHVVVSPAFHNPVPRMSGRGLPRRDESVHSPLPYGYIDELRQMLAAGPHFRDWQWAQSALGVEIGKRGPSGADWFEVTEDQIDRNDPDCVWRARPMTRYAPGNVEPGPVGGTARETHPAVAHAAGPHARLGRGRYLALCGGEVDVEFEPARTGQ